jgi:hypothetical protein
VNETEPNRPVRHPISTNWVWNYPGHGDSRRPRQDDHRQRRSEA